MARVFDGSTGDLANGWYVASATAAWLDGRRLPLCARVYSTAHPDYRSPAAELEKTIASLRQHVRDDSVWTMDQAFDSRPILRVLHRHRRKFIIRMFVPAAVKGEKIKGKGGGRQRSIYVHGQKFGLDNVEASVQTLHTVRMRRTSKKRVRIGWIRTVQLQAYSKAGQALGPGDHTYSLVVVRLSGEMPMALLTNRTVKTLADARETLHAYMDRWVIEERFQFEKGKRDGFHLEDVRLRTWTGLCRMVLFTMLATGFLAALTHTAQDLAIRIAKRAFTCGPLRRNLYYRLLRGLERIWLRRPPTYNKPKPPLGKPLPRSTA